MYSTHRIFNVCAAICSLMLAPMLVGCGNASLFDAINQEDAATVKRLLKVNPSLAKVENASGETGLNKAVERDNPEIAKLLIDAGADVNHDCHRLGLPLHGAAYYGQAEIVKLLLEAGADPSIQTAVPSHCANETALHMGAWGGHPETVELLLEHGADVNARTNDSGWNPLHEPLGAGRRESTQPDVIRILLEYGADVNARTDDGVTPLGRLRELRKSFEERKYHSCTFDFDKAEELLLQYGAKE